MARKSGYRIGEEFVARKHAWMPCVLAENLAGASDEELARAYKATWWADLITNAEWPALLGLPEGKASSRSRLKRKMVGWFMAMGRIAALNPTLYNQAVNEAKALYLEQLGEPHPMFAHDEEEARLRGPSPQPGRIPRL